LPENIESVISVGKNVCVLGAWCILFGRLALHCVQVTVAFQDLPLGLDCLISEFLDLPFAKALRHCISNVGKYPHFSPPSDIFADPQVPLPMLMYQKGFKNLKLQLHQIIF